MYLLKKIAEYAKKGEESSTLSLSLTNLPKGVWKGIPAGVCGEGAFDG